MLAVAIFVALWVVLGLGMFLLASRRGRGPSAAGQRRGSNRFVGIVFGFMVLGFGIALPAAILIGNHVNASAQVGGYKLTSAEKTGRLLFGQHCAVCHTLAATNSVGKVGPNLDTIKPAASLVLRTINNGCLPNAPSGSAQQCLGYGVMPSNVVTGKNARDVASFVAQVAGRE